MTRWEVDSGEADGRVDAIIAKHLGISAHEARRLIADGLVKLDGKATSKGTRAKLGARIEVRAHVRAGERSYDHTPEPEPLLVLDVVYEDDMLVAINKPAGLASHPLRASERNTVAHGIVARWPACAQASLDAREAGLVHRLDRGTTGVLIAAKRRDVWTAVREAFGREDVDKTYWALVEGVMSDERIVDAPLRNAGDRARVDFTDAKALHAVTRVRPLVSGKRYTLVEATARTGRMHQVRAHLGHIGHPLIGDRRYGSSPIEGVPDEALLHARSVAMPHPIDGWKLSISAPLPQGRRELFERLLGKQVPKDR